MDRIKNIIDIIKENKEISDFKLIRKKTSSKELFLIRDAVDMDRSVETDDVSVTIYADTEEDGKNLEETLHLTQLHRIVMKKLQEKYLLLMKEQNS